MGPGTAGAQQGRARLVVLHAVLDVDQAHHLERARQLGRPVAHHLQARLRDGLRRQAARRVACAQLRASFGGAWEAGIVSESAQSCTTTGHCSRMVCGGRPHVRSPAHSSQRQLVRSGQGTLVCPVSVHIWAARSLVSSPPDCSSSSACRLNTALRNAATIGSLDEQWCAVHPSARRPA